VPTLDKVTVDLMVVLGTTSMPIHQVMRLSRGAIIELDATEADEVKILANNLPIASGVDLPLLAYCDATGAPFDAPQQRDGVRWTFLRDYVKLLRSRANVMPEEMVTREEWLGLIRGEVPAAGTLVDGILDADDPEPFYDVLQGELFGFPYTCAC